MFKKNFDKRIAKRKNLFIIRLMDIELGQRIKRIREASGENQQAFARRFDKTQATISRWEAGKQFPERGDLIKLAQLGNISLGRLLEGDSFPTRDRP